MATTLQKTLASILAATAFAGAAGGAEAQSRTRGEDPAEARQRIEDCYTLGKQQGVYKLPQTEKAIQQDDVAKLGCIYSTAAGEKLSVQTAYDLGDTKQARKYANDAASLREKERKAIEKAVARGEKYDDNGNVVRDTAQETKKTVDDVNKTVKSVTGTVKTIDRALDVFKGFGR